jgi:autotransporter-associated beta strand protein
VQVIGAQGDLSSAFLNTTAQTVATNTTVAEVMYRLTGGRQNGQTVLGGGTQEAGVYFKSFDPLTNTATMQVQQYDGTYTKVVFIKLVQSGSNVQALINTANSTGTGAAFKTGNFLGTDLFTGTSSMPLATSAAATGYGVDRLYNTGKVTLTGINTYSGGTTLSNTTTTVASGSNQYSRTALGTLQIADAQNVGGGNISNSGLLIFNGSSASTWNAVISGAGAVLKNGSNTLTVTSSQTYTGDTIVNAGSLQIGDAGTVGALTSNTNLYLPFANANLTVSRSDNPTMANIVQGVGVFAKVGSNTLTLTGNNLHAVFNVDGGSMVVQNDAPTIGGTFNGPGELIIQSAGTSFTSALNLSSVSFGTTTPLGTLTIGKTSNSSAITLDNTLKVNGATSVYGGNIYFNADYV